MTYKATSTFIAASSLFKNKDILSPSIDYSLMTHNTSTTSIASSTCFGTSTSIGSSTSINASIKPNILSPSLSLTGFNYLNFSNTKVSAIKRKFAHDTSQLTSINSKKQFTKSVDLNCINTDINLNFINNSSPVHPVVLAPITSNNHSQIRHINDIYNSLPVHPIALTTSNSDSISYNK